MCKMERTEFDLIGIERTREQKHACVLLLPWEGIQRNAETTGEGVNDGKRLLSF